MGQKLIFNWKQILLSCLAEWLFMREKVRLGKDLRALIKKFRADSETNKKTGGDPISLENDISIKLRELVHRHAGISPSEAKRPSTLNLIKELRFLKKYSEPLASAFRLINRKRVLFVGQAYYNSWYLSRALRELNWKADLLNWDENPDSQIYYHGQDMSFIGKDLLEILEFYVLSLYQYDVFHFANANGITFGDRLHAWFTNYDCKHSEIFLLKLFNKTIVYSNNGCLDGVSQSSFAKWRTPPICDSCPWKHQPEVCSDDKNLTFGSFRNSVADYQCLLGGNRVDFNLDASVHEEPEFYCLDRQIWHPDIEIPPEFKLPPSPPGTVYLYHAVGNKAMRTNAHGVNIKSSHIYEPLIQKLRNEGSLIELIGPTGVPNINVRFLQARADIFLEMLTYGWFGANAREAMMLGKTVICYISPDWLASVREEIPEYADDLPIVSATETTVEDTLRDLIASPEKRKNIGDRGRAFALKWHSSEAGAQRFDTIYSRLLQNNKIPHASRIGTFPRAV